MDQILNDRAAFKEQEYENHERLLEELLANSQKQLFYARIRTVALMIFVLGGIICGVILLPPLLTTVNHANDIMLQTSETITLANEAIESVTQMSETITDMGDNMDTFITENSQSIADVMKKIDEIDFEGLNGAIKDLGDVVEPLAKFFGKFK